MTFFKKNTKILFRSHDADSGSVAASFQSSNIRFLNFKITGLRNEVSSGEKNLQSYLHCLLISILFEFAGLNPALKLEL